MIEVQILEVRSNILTSEQNNEAVKVFRLWIYGEPIKEIATKYGKKKTSIKQLLTKARWLLCHKIENDKELNQIIKESYKENQRQLVNFVWSEFYKDMLK